MPDREEFTAKDAVIGLSLWFGPVVITAIVSASQQPPGQRWDRAVPILVYGPMTVVWALSILHVIISYFKIVSIISPLLLKEAIS
jgi:hypothetical protein